MVTIKIIIFEGDMDKETAIKLFEEQKVRVEWDENQEKWWFSIVDVVRILTDISLSSCSRIVFSLTNF